MPRKLETRLARVTRLLPPVPLPVEIVARWPDLPVCCRRALVQGLSTDDIRRILAALPPEKRMRVLDIVEQISQSDSSPDTP